MKSKNDSDTCGFRISTAQLGRMIERKSHGNSTRTLAVVLFWPTLKRLVREYLWQMHNTSFTLPKLFHSLQRNKVVIVCIESGKTARLLRGASRIIGLPVQ